MAVRRVRSVMVIGGWFVAGLLSLVSPLGAQVKYTGVNLPSGSYANADRKGEVYPYTWSYPSQASVDYFLNKGMNTFRTGVLWDRLQPTLNGDLDGVEMGRLDEFVNATTAKGAYVIIDPHDSARHRGKLIGTAEVPATAFADFWGKMAGHYKGNDHVILGLTNEPYEMQQSVWVAAAGPAVAAIRAAGAKNLILVPGNRWTGAWTWDKADKWGESNASTLKNIADPGGNMAIEVHQYFDQWGSGTSTEIYSGDPDLGVKRIEAFTQWLRQSHMKGFLGEFAVANSTIGTGDKQIGDELLTRMLSYMQDNSDVWEGWTWWSAGRCWDDNYMFLAEPTGLGKPEQADRAVMSVMERFVSRPRRQP